MDNSRVHFYNNFLNDILEFTLLHTDAEKRYSIGFEVNVNGNFSLLELYISNKEKVVIERINIASSNSENSYDILYKIGVDLLTKLYRILTNGYTFIFKNIKEVA